jgi:hypothetical protein
MSDRIAPDADAREALGAAVEALAAQAVVLNRMFYRAAGEALSGSVGSHGDLRKALRAQAQCRTTLKILLTLRRAAADAKKSRISTKELLKA